MNNAIRSTTQEQIDVEDILDDIILQKDGTCSLVLQTNAINFGLLSEEEQDATIYAYAAFLNSLTFDIQILIRSDVKDISGYLSLLNDQENKQNNPAKKQQINYYKKFISSLITERNVLEKKFYIVIPFYTLELGVSQSVSANLFKSRSKKLPFEKSYIIEKAKANLEPKRDHVLRQLGRVGLFARQLTTQELIQLLFSMYNASSTQGQKISNTKDYMVPLVQPAYIEEDKMANDNNQTQTPNPASAGVNQQNSQIKPDSGQDQANQTPQPPTNQPNTPPNDSATNQPTPQSTPNNTNQASQPNLNQASMSQPDSNQQNSNQASTSPSIPYPQGLNQNTDSEPSSPNKQAVSPNQQSNQVNATPPPPPPTAPVADSSPGQNTSTTQPSPDTKPSPESNPTPPPAPSSLSGSAAPTAPDTSQAPAANPTPTQQPGQPSNQAPQPPAAANQPNTPTTAGSTSNQPTPPKSPEEGIDAAQQAINSAAGDISK